MTDEQRLRRGPAAAGPPGAVRSRTLPHPGRPAGAGPTAGGHHEQRPRHPHRPPAADHRAAPPRSSRLARRRGGRGRDRRRRLRRRLLHAGQRHRPAGRPEHDRPSTSRSSSPCRRRRPWPASARSRHPSCSASADVAFAGTVTAIDGDVVTLAPTETYAGASADEIEVVGMHPDIRALGGQPEFVVGGTYLVVGHRRAGVRLRLQRRGVARAPEPLRPRVPVGR